jgi:hypothetical protein
MQIDEHQIVGVHRPRVAQGRITIRFSAPAPPAADSPTISSGAIAWRGLI